MSNFYGTSYSLSLLHNVRDSEGFTDFDPIQSMEGVYIANHYDYQQAEIYRGQIETLKKSNAKKIDT